MSNDNSKQKKHKCDFDKSKDKYGKLNKYRLGKTTWKRTFTKKGKGWSHQLGWWQTLAPLVHQRALFFRL